MRTVFPVGLDNVWMYLRKSREDREIEERARRNGTASMETLARHRNTLLELAHQSGHHIEHVLEELVSGEFISDRPEMQRLLSAVSSGEVTAVWVMDLDRLGRGDMADQGTILRSFRESSTLILTPEKVFDLGDEMDEEWTEFKTFFARRELKMITKRLQRGRVASVREGKFIGSRPPFGFDVNNNLVLVPNGDADTVRLIFHLYVHQAMGSTRIAQHLNTMGARSPAGLLWSGDSVLSILKNRVYAGYMEWRKTYGDKRHPRGSKRPEPEWIRASGRHEPLIDEATFQRAEQIRIKRSHSPAKPGHGAASPLTGIVECGKCGGKMVKRSYTKQAAHLICKKTACDNRSTRLSIVEERMVEALRSYLDGHVIPRHEVIQTQSPASSPQTIAQRQLNEITAAVNRLSAQRDRVHDLLEQGVYDMDTFRERHLKLEADLANLEGQQKAAAEAARRDPADRPHPPDIPDTIHLMDAYAMTQDMTARNRLLKSILARAVYTKESWQTGDQFVLELFLKTGHR